MSGIGLVLGWGRWKGYQVEGVLELEDCCSQDTDTAMNWALVFVGNYFWYLRCSDQEGELGGC